MLLVGVGGGESCDKRRELSGFEGGELVLVEGDSQVEARAWFDGRDEGEDLAVLGEDLAGKLQFAVGVDHVRHVSNDGAWVVQYRECDGQ